MSKALIIALLLYSSVFCRIIHLQDTISLNSLVAFKTERLEKLKFDSGTWSPECKSADTTDFFFMGAKLYVCICFLDTYWLGSSRPFYSSTTSLDAADLSKNIDLANPALFRKNDTVRIPSGSLIRNYKPHVPGGAGDVLDKTSFLVLQTKSGYVLLTYKNLWWSFKDYSLGTITSYQKILLDAYFQDDKSLNFSEVPQLIQTKTKPRPITQTRPAIITSKTQYYDLKGKIITTPSLKNGVIIFNNKPIVQIH